jgi:alkylation response protein AidB-like acyl-CoA dehydrogenase
VPFVEQFWDVVRMVQSRGTASDSRVRQELARAFIEIELIRYRGIQQLGDVVSDNGESPIGTMSKIGWSEHARQFSQAIMNLRGPMGMIMPDHGRYEPDQMTANFLFAPGLTIAGGTSEILRNVLAERILGLPREER